MQVNGSYRARLSLISYPRPTEHNSDVCIIGHVHGSDMPFSLLTCAFYFWCFKSPGKAAGSSPCPLPWELRLKIAKGVARGLSYIHEKKHVHGNLKPSNIVLGFDMEPKIGDFGLERLVTGDTSSRPGGSARNFGSKRSTASRDSFQDLTTPSPSSSVIGLSPYHAPESLRSLKPHPKWDVFSFGVVLLELLTGKVIVSDETGPGLVIGASDENKGKILKIADAAIRGEMEGKEEALLALLKLGYSCISPVPQKRPSMKEVLQALERFPTCSFS